MNLADGARVVVTGGAGFLGSTLVDLLLERRCRVVVLDDLSTGSLCNLATGNPSLRIHTLKIGDPAKASALDKELALADAVFHLASPIGVMRAHAERYAVTRGILESTAAVVDSCLRHRRPLLYASSSEVYGAGRDQPITESDPVVSDLRPRWGYAVAKAAGEHMVAGMFHEFGVPSWIVRPFNMAGPRQRPATGQAIPAFVSAALRGEPIVVHDDGSQRRSFLHVADAAEALILIMECAELQGRPVNLGSTEPIRIGELARLVAAVTGSRAPIVCRPSQAIFGEAFAATADRTPDTHLLQHATGWQPVRTVRQAIIDCAAHLGSERAAV